MLSLSLPPSLPPPLSHPPSPPLSPPLSLSLPPLSLLPFTAVHLYTPPPPTTRVDSELDLIHTQQQELEELLTTLEKELDQIPSHGVGVHYADMQRTKT